MALLHWWSSKTLVAVTALVWLKTFMTFFMVFQSGSTYELLVATATFVWFLFSMHSLVRSPTSRCLQNLAAIAAFVMFSWRIIIVLWLLAKACFLIYQRHVQNAFKVQRWSPSRKEKVISGQLLKSCACLNRNDVLIMEGIPAEPMFVHVCTSHKPYSLGIRLNVCFFHVFMAAFTIFSFVLHISITLWTCKCSYWPCPDKIKSTRKMGKHMTTTAKEQRNFKHIFFHFWTR